MVVNYFNNFMHKVDGLMWNKQFEFKNSCAAYGPGNSNRLKIVIIHETNALKISSALKDSSLMK